MAHRNKEAQKEYRLKYNELNKERIKEYTKEYNLKNKERSKEANIIYREATLEASLYRSAKRRASKSEIPFSLEPKDIVFPDYCPYLNCKLTRIQGKGHYQTNASIDRIDSSKGYTKDNIEIISYLANRMKAEATKEQLIAFAKGVLKKYA